MNNEQRSNRFESALMSLAGEYDDVRTSLTDLLADARHWCDCNDESFAEFDRIAYQHYLAELHEKQTEEGESP
jgi:hypothetical protein